MATYDLLLSGGTLIDPAQAIHGPRVAAVAERIDPAAARQVVECAGLLVAPGLSDLQ